MTFTLTHKIYSFNLFIANQEDLQHCAYYAMHVYKISKQLNKT